MLPKALKSCPKSTKLPNLVTLTTALHPLSLASISERKILHLEIKKKGPKEGPLTLIALPGAKDHNLKWADIKLSVGLTTSVTRKESPNVYKSCPKMISLEKY